MYALVFFTLMRHTITIIDTWPAIIGVLPVTARLLTTDAPRNRSFMRLLGLSVAAVVAICFASSAFAFESEFGFSLEPALIVLPAVANENTLHTLVPAPAGTLSFEYSPLHWFSLLLPGWLCLLTLGQQNWTSHFFRSHGRLLFSAKCRPYSYWLACPNTVVLIARTILSQCLGGWSHFSAAKSGTL